MANKATANALIMLNIHVAPAITAESLHRYLKTQIGANAKDLSWYVIGAITFFFAPSGTPGPDIESAASKSGHIVLAKGFASSDLNKNFREAKYYIHLRHLQRVHVSVCLATVEQGYEILKYDTWDGELVIAGLLLLGWAGHGVDSWPKIGNSRRGEASHAFVRGLPIGERKALTEINKVGVWHRDVALRNVLVRSFRRQDEGPRPRWHLQIVLTDIELSWTRSKYRK